MAPSCVRPKLPTMNKASRAHLDAVLHHVHGSVTSMLILSLTLCLLLYASQGQAIPASEWQPIDIVGEGGFALVAGFWAALIARSRPGGRVTLLLTGGLSAIMLGNWVDCLDEFFQLPQGIWWDNVLESGLSVTGMLVLTMGLLDWRQEQFRITEHFERRERLFRDHRALDRITQLANADYLRRQLRLERHRAPDRPCALIMLDLDRFHLVNREHGAREGDRVLQAISQILLLNLRHDDLLCRYAGDRFVLLLPDTEECEAIQMAEHLAGMVGLSRLHTRNGGHRLQLTARVACAMAHTDLDVLVDGLNAAIECTDGAQPEVAPLPTASV